MLFQVLVIVIVVLAAFFLLDAFSGRSTSKRRQQAAEADVLLTKAERHMLVGELGEAELFFSEALKKAEDAHADLLSSEALYGLARIENKRGDFSQAAAHLERAVQLSTSWKVQKPDFERLIRMELASTRKSIERPNK